ncbi:hypothetical protein KKG65_01610 [Patescibacteria group bacterium]|nr:hypothetical protein [Patescibacteria group bacterium]
MAKINRFFVILLVFLFLSPCQIGAADQNIVTPVYIVRGREYWRQTKDITELTKMIFAVEESGLNSTWLIQFDALQDQQIVDQLKNLSNRHELGLYIEVTRKLADKSFVYYDWTTGHWSAANKIFLSGYEIKDRQRLIDTSFSYFKEVFGKYPKSYGSWYQDGYSLEYIKEKYGLDTVLGLADQYSTDGYQTWGQYINQPYYVSKKSSLEPALNAQDNTDVVKVLWAPREPTLSYGKDKSFSNYSLQANDYRRAQGLTTSFFEKLLNTSTTNIIGQLAQVVVGIEVSELEDQCFNEITNQLNLLKSYQNSGLIKTQTLSQFGKLYKQTFKEVSPSVFTQSEDKNISSYWFNSPNYRAGFFYEKGQLELRDLRFYHQNGYRDNDQANPDPNENLTRVVPAVVDDLILSNKIVIGKTTTPKVLETESLVTITTDNGQIKLYPKKPVIPGLDNLSIPESKTVADIKKTKCSDEYGGYQHFPCINKFIVTLQSLIPDIRYSSLFGQRYLGVKTSPETLFAIRFPNIKIDNFHFDYPLLDDFISTSKKTKPNFPWLGKQEQELEFIGLSNQAIRKSGSYGEENLVADEDKKILFENSYYVIFEK